MAKELVYTVYFDDTHRLIIIFRTFVIMSTLMFDHSVAVTLRREARYCALMRMVK